MWTANLNEYGVWRSSAVEKSGRKERSLVHPSAPAGAGESHPVPDNGAAEGRALNRRTEIQINC